MARGGSGGRRTSRSRDGAPKRSPAPQRDPGGGRNVAAVRDLVVRTVLAPLNAVLLSRRHIEDVVDDAVRRGRMTRDDAQALVQSLLQRGARQTDDFLADLERLLGRGRNFDEPPTARSSEATPGRRSRRRSTSLPIADYDELSAAGVQERLEGLSPAELRKLYDYERRHANRKTVLDPIERRLR
jgi:polyhydroxyalkanoate synthesis regulator phasin